MFCLAALPVVGAGLVRSSYVTGVGVALEQPVPFSHKHHSGELGIDCRYCHTTVETQATAGLPPTHTCMTCHAQIWSGSAMLEPVRASLARDEPLRWQRLNKLPGYVYYNHAVHVGNGIGLLDLSRRRHGHAAHLPANAFEMSFCLDCHRNPEKYVRPKDRILDMTWTPPANQAEIGPELVRQYHIRGGERLTECAICHR